MAPSAAAAAAEASLTIDWDNVAQISKTTATLQVVVNPLIQRGSPIHDNVFKALKDLHADYVRFVPWLPYPRLGVAELEPPANGRTSWDFSLLDPLVEDFEQATRGHSNILNFSIIPEWMWDPSQPPPPADPSTIDFGYEQGTQLAVPVQTVADYYARLVSWYTAGGFTDEYGTFHKSNHHYPLPYWEVLNEIDAEHTLSPQLYTQLYDAIVKAIHEVSPRTQFVGLALSNAALAEPGVLDYFNYFLDPANHQPGTPLEWISYHIYLEPGTSETEQTYGPDTYPTADMYLSKVTQIEAIRQSLAPHVRTTVNETGTLLLSAATQANPEPIPNAYWNYSGGAFAYIFANLALQGIDAVGQSQLVGYPGQFPSVSMVDWHTGLPNARYRVLQLLMQEIPPGSALIPLADGTEPDAFFGLGVRSGGRRKLLLINKTDGNLLIQLAGLRGGSAKIVDQESAGGPIRTEGLMTDEFNLPGYGVAVLALWG